MFLNCAAQLQLSPNRCAVIEDAVVGIEAANRAGCLSIALVAEGRDVNLFDDADQVVREMTSLSPEQIREWLVL